jgi:hypothetical protein
MASDADDFERAVLESGLDERPPTAAEREVWRNLLLAMPPPGTVPGAPPVAAAGATLGALGKGFLLGVAGTAALATAGRWAEHLGDPSARAMPAVVSAPRRAPAAPLGVREPRVAKTTDGAEAPSVAPLVTEETPGSASLPAHRSLSSAAAPDSRALPASTGSVATFPDVARKGTVLSSRLEEEAKLLAKARGELRAGKLAAAFGTLEASRERFSAPELLQEREALLIELLYRSGERTVAAARARAFLRRFPESPHGEVVRAFAGSP